MRVIKTSSRNVMQFTEDTLDFKLGPIDKIHIHTVAQLL